MVGELGTHLNTYLYLYTMEFVSLRDDQTKAAKYASSGTDYTTVLHFYIEYDLLTALNIFQFFISFFFSFLKHFSIAIQWVDLCASSE